MKVVTMGEIMLRLSTPGNSRFVQTDTFDACYGGGEANVAVSLANYGHEAYFVSKVPAHEIGQCAINALRRYGVHTEYVARGGDRLGIYYLETGASMRPSKVIYDRAHASIAEATPEDFDFDYVFGRLGVRWLHTGGIYAALSEQSCETVIAACKAAKKYGTLVSYDLNYRPSMWSAIGGLDKAREVNREVAKYVDVMIGNEEDFTACLGFEIEGNDANLKELNLDGYYKMIAEAAKQYPNFKAIATTLRTVKTATVNDWKAICWADGNVYMSKAFDNLEILDRVGGGDSFASGLIYGLMTTGDPELAVNYGAAHGALAMTTPGDTSMASKEEVESIIKNGSARVKR